jgi:succinate dehydrogenase / fumarate reductase membrane anchor subunit
MSFRTDRQRVRGLGTAREGVGHWWGQRLSSVALVPLTLVFVLQLAALLGSDHAAVRAHFAAPFNAIVAILFLGTMFWHLMQGLQVVIEDYVHDKPVRTALLVANMLLCWALGLTGVFSVARMAFA